MRTSYIRRMHPLLTITAVSLTLFSLLGIGALSGLMATAKAERMESLPMITTAAPIRTEPKIQVADVVTPRNQSDAAIVHITPPARPANKTSSTAADAGVKVCGHCGEVAAIDLVKHEGETSGLGAIADGVTGGLVGNQIGKNKDNILMTILGASGGTYAGHSIEQTLKATIAYVVKVQMDDGSTRIVTLADKPSFDVGDQVKVINGGLSVIS